MIFYSEMIVPLFFVPSNEQHFTKIHYHSVLILRDIESSHLGKHLSTFCHPHVGIAQIAFKPPPRTQTGTLGELFFRRDFTILPFLPFSLNKCPKPSGQGFRPPPQNQANARLNLEKSSLKKCPKPSGQGFRPPQTGNAQIEVAPH